MVSFISRPVKIGMVQINNSFSGQSYLPYAVSLLEAYYKTMGKNTAGVEFLLPIYDRIPVDIAVKSLIDADIVAFSTYVWNIRISSEIAKRLKAQKPSIRIIFGGPQVPDVIEPFLRANPFVDIAVHGEGEQVFVGLIDERDGNWQETPGISFLTSDGVIRTNPKVPRIKELDTIPSPYLSGALESLMQAHPHQKWIALWETNRGCPFSCTYCDWGSSTQSRVYQFSIERLYREIDWFAEKKIEFVFCCDANYGILPRDLDITQYAAEVKKKTSYPNALSVQNTKNATERAYLVQKTLSDAGLNKGVTLAIQSMDKQTLKNIKRENISLESYHELQRRFTRDRVETYSDYILALPGESFDATVNGICALIENGQHNRIQFNNLSILPNAAMGSKEYQKEFGMVIVETDIINIHGSLSEASNDIVERQQLVVGTAAMPKEDWVRTRAFCWLTALLHFDKVLQIPLLFVHKLGDVPFKEILMRFAEGDLTKYPVLAKICDFFRNAARDIQKGSPEFIYSKEYLDIFWPADELILINMIASGQINDFYDESQSLLLEILGGAAPSLKPIIEDAVKLNRNLLKVPFQSTDLDLSLRYNIMDCYKAYLVEEEVPIMESPVTYHINRTNQAYWTWDDYCREVIWYGNKKGAYLYTNSKVEPQIAGIY
jgi:tRNA A37 methylthiotransferase MiaB